MIRRSLAPRLTALIAVVALAAAAGACAGGTPYAAVPNGGAPSPSPSPSPTGSPADCVVAITPAAVQTIGINLTNPAQAACDDSTFLAVKGYFGGSSVTTSQVVSVTHSGTNVIRFVNLDTQQHTAGNIGAWTGSYPPNGPGFGNPSPKDTDISAAGFTTGLLNPGQTSRDYLANVPGMWVIGCAIHYNSDNMRTVIIVN